MTEYINEFADLFGIKLTPVIRGIIEKQNRLYMLSPQLRKLTKKEFFCAGTYLGKVKDGKFFPSFSLLMMISSNARNRIVVNSRSEWLFTCGRDVFRKGITNISGSTKKGTYTLVFDEQSECLGFGRIMRNLDADTPGNMEAVRNILDLGDFLRREQ